jgi:hypothetical protein
MFNFNSRTLSLLNFLINCYNILIVVFINKNLGYILYHVNQKLSKSEVSAAKKTLLHVGLYC